MKKIFLLILMTNFCFAAENESYSERVSVEGYASFLSGTKWVGALPSGRVETIYQELGRKINGLHPRPTESDDLKFEVEFLDHSRHRFTIYANRGSSDPNCVEAREGQYRFFPVAFSMEKALSWKLTPNPGETFASEVCDWTSAFLEQQVFIRINERETSSGEREYFLYLIKSHRLFSPIIVHRLKMVAN